MPRTWHHRRLEFRVVVKLVYCSPFGLVIGRILIPIVWYICLLPQGPLTAFYCESNYPPPAHRCFPRILFWTAARGIQMLTSIGGACTVSLEVQRETGKANPSGSVYNAGEFFLAAFFASVFYKRSSKEVWSRIGPTSVSSWKDCIV